MKKSIVITSIIMLAVLGKAKATNDSLLIFLNGSLSSQAQYIPVGSTSGVSDASKITVNLSSTGASLTVTELKCYFSGNNVATAVSVGSITAPVINSVAYLIGLNIIVPAGSTGINIDAYISYPPAGSSGVASGSTVQVQSLFAKYIGNSVAKTVTIPIAAPTMTLVGSSLTISAIQGIQGTISIGTNKIADISIATSSLGVISIGKLQFVVGSQGFTSRPQLSNIEIKDVNNISISVQYTISPVTSDNRTSIIDCVFSPVQYFIGAGQTQQFKIYATISNGFPNSGEAVSIFTSLNYNPFLWTDVEGNGLPNVQNGYGLLASGFPSGTYILTNAATTGVKENLYHSQINAYPNPMLDYCILSFNNNDLHTVRLYDLSGREVKTVQVSGETRINRDNLPSGIYSYKVFSDKGQLAGSGKIIAE